MDDNLNAHSGGHLARDPRPVFVGDGVVRRRTLRGAALVCLIACAGFFGAIVGGLTASSSVKEGQHPARSNESPLTIHRAGVSHNSGGLPGR